MKNLAEPITPIRDEATHRAALAEIERLWGVESNTPEGDRLDVLMAHVDDYERLNWPEVLDPIDAIHARTETSGRTRKDFEKIVGSSGRASAEILTRKRHLTLPMIWAARGGMENARRGSCAPLQARSAGNK